MKQIEDFLRTHHYSNDKGYFSTHHLDDQGTAADQIWSGLAQDNPIFAAAATRTADPFAKYPHLVEAEVPDENNLILDAGCGYGRVAIPLLRTKGQIELVGVDASTVMLSHFLDLLAQEAEASEMKRRVTLIHSSINRLPFDPGTFDCIYSCAVLLHNPYMNVVGTVAEFYRLLRPSGTLILVGSFPNALTLEGVQNYFYLKFIDEPTRNGPVRVYTRKRVSALFDKWSNVRVLSSGVTTIPRHLANTPLPFGRSIRRLNEWLAQKNLATVAKTSLFVRFFDVVARK